MYVREGVEDVVIPARVIDWRRDEVTECGVLAVHCSWCCYAGSVYLLYSMPQYLVAIMVLTGTVRKGDAEMLK